MKEVETKNDAWNKFRELDNESVCDIVQMLRP
jgi:hypothetical protein